VLEIVDGVFEIGMGYVNVHAIFDEHGVVLVDTGLPGRAGKVEQALHGLGRNVGDVHTVLLTHRHPDHVGAAAELRRRSGARVVVHAADAAAVTGVDPMAPTGVMKAVGLFIKAPEPVPVDETLGGDGATPVLGFRAVYTTGHTRGHVSYLLDRAGGVLFAGDAAFSLAGKIRRPPRVVTDNMAIAEASIKRLAGLEFDVALFGHGRAITGRAVNRFREFAAR
jgi:glyoxylase-like metal-dependent hydrolase (beta-lactamase superfamily II)